MPGHPFLVHVAKLRRVVGTRWHERRQGTMAGLDCSGSAVPPHSVVSADVVLDSVIGGVAVTGTVSAPWAGECRRCLAPASGTLRVEVRELYTEGSDGEDTYPLDDDVVDLEPLVHDAVLLELPVAPLCRAECRGLCPVCGVNRNDEPCTCAPVADPRWSALDVLRTPPAPGPPE